LNQALSIYAAPVSGGKVDLPIIEKSKLIEELRKDIDEMISTLDEWGISISEIMSSEGLKCVKLIDDAIECILESEERQSKFREKNSIIQRTYKAILPDASASEFHPTVKTLQVLSEKLNSLSPTVDISEVMKEAKELFEIKKNKGLPRIPLADPLSLQLTYFNASSIFLFIQCVCIFGIHFSDSGREFIFYESLYKWIRIEGFRSVDTLDIPNPFRR